MRKLAILAAFAVVAGATAVQAQGGTPPVGARGQGRGPGGRGGPGAMGMDRVLLRGITLSDAQKAKLQDLREAERAKMQEGRDENRGDFEAIREARAKGDTATVRRLVEAQRVELEKRRDAQIAAVRALLTSDQLTQFDANVAEMKKRGPGMRGEGAGQRGASAGAAQRGGRPGARAQGGRRGRGTRPPQA